MSPRLVLDASAAVCWASPDEAPPAALADAIAAGGCLAPALWAYEVHNVLLVLQRRKRLTSEGHAAAHAALAALGVELETPTWGLVEHAVLHLARKHALSVYDAAYLELAMRRRLPLATFDQLLRKAALAENIALV
jgi:predicted nucleic acid-binding protein